MANVITEKAKVNARERRWGIAEVHLPVAQRLLIRANPYFTQPYMQKFTNFFPSQDPLTNQTFTFP